MADDPPRDPRARADELARAARAEASSNPLEGLPKAEPGLNRNPLEGLPRVQTDFNRNPLDVPKVGTPSEGGSGGVAGLLILGVIVLVAGIGLLVYANSRAPTLENALTKGEVLTPGAYDLFRFGGWAAVAIGALMAIAALLRSNRR